MKTWDLTNPLTVSKLFRNTWSRSLCLPDFKQHTKYPPRFRHFPHQLLYLLRRSISQVSLALTMSNGVWLLKARLIWWRVAYGIGAYNRISQDRSKQYRNVNWEFANKEALGRMLPWMLHTNDFHLLATEYEKKDSSVFNSCSVICQIDLLYVWQHLLSDNDIKKPSCVKPYGPEKPYLRISGEA